MSGRLIFAGGLFLRGGSRCVGVAAIFAGGAPLQGGDIFSAGNFRVYTPLP